MILPIHQVRAGMIVRHDVYAREGMKLIARGTELTDQHIERMKSHRIGFVEIDSGNAVIGGAASSSAPNGQPVSPPDISEEEMYAILRSIPLFHGFREGQLSFIIQHSALMKYPAATVLFHEHDQGDSFLVILRGTVKIYIRNRQGQEKILSLLKEGDSFGELSLIDGGPRSASAQTLEETELLHLSRRKFYELIQAHPDLSRTIMIELSKRLRDANHQICDLAFHNARYRIIKNLLLLATRFGKRKQDDDVIYVKMPFHWEELAQMAVVKKSELYEMIRDLEARNILRMNENSYEIRLALLR